ncbi:hypothetical protein B0H10DRAFT_2208288 [Mycena sp. CBHHK59/15]|nr:hypothetical protein B0H10DRAFT_2208288 [Mycena sp. CBHHK59/15]
MSLQHLPQRLQCPLRYAILHHCPSNLAIESRDLVVKVGAHEQQPAHLVQRLRRLPDPQPILMLEDRDLDRIIFAALPSISPGRRPQIIYDLDRHFGRVRTCHVDLLRCPPPARPPAPHPLPFRTAGSTHIPPSRPLPPPHSSLRCCFPPSPPAASRPPRPLVPILPARCFLPPPARRFTPSRLSRWCFHPPACRAGASCPSRSLLPRCFTLLPALPAHWFPPAASRLLLPALPACCFLPPPLLPLACSSHIPSARCFPPFPHVVPLLTALPLAAS